MAANLGFFRYALGVTCLGLCLEWVFCMGSLSGLKIRRRVELPERNGPVSTIPNLQIGDELAIRLTVTNNNLLPIPWMFGLDPFDGPAVRDGPPGFLSHIGSATANHLRYGLTATHRGLIRIGPTRVENSGPFGLIKRVALGAGADFATVLPRVVPIQKHAARANRPIPEVPRRRSLFEDPSRFVGIRRVRHGESMRRIHWRATARSGVLQRKLFEPSVLGGITLAVHMGHTDDLDDPVELAITCAASLSQHTLQSGLRVGLVSNGRDQAEDFPEAVPSPMVRHLDQQSQATAAHTAWHDGLYIESGRGAFHGQQLLTVLARLAPSASLDLPTHLNRCLPHLNRELQVVVITPSLEAEMTDSIAALYRVGLEISVIWIRPPESILPRHNLPSNVRLHVISRPSDIAKLTTV